MVPSALRRLLARSDPAAYVSSLLYIRAHGLGTLGRVEPRMPVAHLSGRGVVRLAGADALSLLQGLVTNDLDGMKPGDARFAGLLTPQGKILFDFLVVAGLQGEILLDAPRTLTADIVKRLMFYRLRAKVDITDMSAGHAVLVAWGTHPLPTAALRYPDPRHSALGTRAIVSDPPPPVSDSEEAWQAHRITLGVPEGGQDYAWGDTFAHEALYDRLSGVSFDKGCYVGQEIVSRMQHRGTARKRILPVRANGDLPPPGTPVMAGDASIGSLGSRAGAHGLAVVRVDRVWEARTRGTPITAAGTPLDIEVPDWAVPKALEMDLNTREPSAEQP